MSPLRHRSLLIYFLNELTAWRGQETRHRMIISIGYLLFTLSDAMSQGIIDQQDIDFSLHTVYSTIPEVLRRAAM